MCPFKNLKLFSVPTSYHMDDHLIQKSSSATYLGVTIDHRLNWKEHINKVVAKSNSVNAFLKRNLSGCSIKVKKNCYMAMVQLVIEYTAIIWSPYTYGTAQSCKIYNEQLYTNG